MHSKMANISTEMYSNMENISFRDFSDNTEDQKIDAFYKGYLITGVIIFIAGAFLSLWFLVAIFRSQKVRSRLRNKVICNTLLIILLDCLLVEPLSNIAMLHMYYDHCYTCIHYSVIDHLGEIQDFMENWILVILLAIFIAQIQNVHPLGIFSQMISTVATSAILLLPWVVSVIVVPFAFYAISSRSSDSCHCLYIESSDIDIFTSISIAIPLCLSLTLVIIAAFLRYRRFSRGDSTDAVSTELISSGAETEIDSAYVYGIAVVVSVVCEFPDMIGSFMETANENITHNYMEWFNFMLISATVRQLRVVLLPLVWLLFPDIRQQIKTWRPWRRPPLDADMTVTYRKECD